MDLTGSCPGREVDGNLKLWSPFFGPKEKKILVLLDWENGALNWTLASNLGLMGVWRHFSKLESPLFRVILQAIAHRWLELFQARCRLR